MVTSFAVSFNNSLSAAGIIHGDINPRNVLIFEECTKIIARVADFGFTTCFQGVGDLVSMPQNEPWNAPEHHHRHFRPEQAKQMDIYSFGMLCFWLIFEAGSSGGLPLPSSTTLDGGQIISFERCRSDKNMILDWKNDDNNNKLVNLVYWLVLEDVRFSSSVKENLMTFFQLTLVSDPQLRCSDLEHVLSLLMPDR